MLSSLIHREQHVDADHPECIEASGMLFSLVMHVYVRHRTDSYPQKIIKYARVSRWEALSILMTTNALDLRALMAATDSRWSYILKDGEKIRAVVYADDTGFDKVVIGQGACALFAGPSNLIDEWKEYIKSPNKIVLRRPVTQKGFSVCIFDAATGRLVFEHGQDFFEEGVYRFAGSGAGFAKTCWIANKDVIKAVRTASASDDYSGGTVKFFDVKKQEHNVDLVGQYSLINEAITKRGIVMYATYDGKEISIHDAAKKDPAVQTLLRDIAAGNASAVAPTGPNPVVWTAADEKRLDESLEAFFGPIAK